mgnify:CR=1 FL=1
MAEASPTTLPENVAPVIAVEGLRTELALRDRVLPAVIDVSFALKRGQTLGVVGESGCGKSMTALSIARLLPPIARIAAGRLLFDGRDLVGLPEPDMRRVRGRDISMIFQEPMTSLNPVKTIGYQIAEVLMLHVGLTRRQAWDAAIEKLRLVKIPEPARRAGEYPHQLSGGMRQRVMIAIALACNPKLLLADEPTTALDVTIQAQIMELMAELQESLGTAIMLITHDLGLVAENADRVIVMYAGRKVEEAEVNELFAAPCHPYTLGLLGSIPELGASLTRTGRGRLSEIKGSVPSLTQLPPGCAFAPRCGFASEQCHRAVPPLEEKRPGHIAACWHADRVLESLS